MDIVFVGIAGGSASGKSSLAQGLCDALGDRCLLLLHDRYYHSLPSHLRDQPLAHNYDHPDALDTGRLVEDLSALRAGRRVGLPCYDYACHARSEQEEPVDPRPVVLVEGILVLADPRLRALLDHGVYVATPDDIRLARRILRDIHHRGRAVDDVVARYLATVRPMHHEFVAPSRAHASLVVDGTQPLERSVASVLALPGVSPPGAP